MCLGGPLIAQTPSTEPNVSLDIVTKIDRNYLTLIEKLNCCENYCNWDDNTIVDSNLYKSYGGLMFQLKSFIYFGKKFDVLPEWVDVEYAKTIIYDQDIQTAIAIQMIKHDLGPTTYGWKNCWRKHNLGQYLDN